jgi:hypothetical protein
VAELILFNSFWADAGLFFWIFAFLACLIAIFGILPDLFRDKSLSGGVKALWVLFLIFVPFLAVLVYVIVRGRGMGERRLAEFNKDMATSASFSGGAMPVNEIALAKQMLDEGAITQADYDKLRADGNA